MAIVDAHIVLDRPLLFPVSANEASDQLKGRGDRRARGFGVDHRIGSGRFRFRSRGERGGRLIQPRSHVDVLFTRPGSMADAITTTILEDVIVLSIGRTTEVAPSATNVNPGAARPQSQTATLLVTPEQTRKLELAKNQGKISLALRNPLDRSTSPDDKPTTTRHSVRKRVRRFRMFATTGRGSSSPALIWRGPRRKSRPDRAASSMCIAVTNMSRKFFHEVARCGWFDRGALRRAVPGGGRRTRAYHQPYRR
jgi:hypothetical protein